MRATSQRFTYFFLEMLTHGPDTIAGFDVAERWPNSIIGVMTVDGPPGSLDQPAISPLQE